LTAVEVLPSASVATPGRRVAPPRQNTAVDERPDGQPWGVISGQ